MRRVLIIDDEEDIREVAALSLESTAHWTVLTANCAHQGIQTAAAQQPDVILLDLMMPGMDGPATFHQLQQNPATSRIPVILLTAGTAQAERKRLNTLGFAAILHKPFDPLTLAAQIRQVLGWQD